MSYHWAERARALPIVEFHDVRAEPGAGGRYLGLQERLAPALAASGGTPLGQFAIAGHPERLLVLRGFPSLADRRRALLAFHEGTAWATERAAAADLTRAARVMLTRTVAPPDGLRPIRAGAGVVALVSELRFAEQIGSYHLWLRLLLRKAGLDPLAAFATLEAANDVPAVPVVRNRTQHIALLPRGDPPPALPPELRDMVRFPPEALTLAPAAQFVW